MPKGIRVLRAAAPLRSLALPWGGGGRLPTTSSTPTKRAARPLSPAALVPIKQLFHGTPPPYSMRAAMSTPSGNKSPQRLSCGLFSCYGVVSPGFEPSQRESKSLVLPLHHETTLAAGCIHLRAGGFVTQGTAGSKAKFANAKKSGSRAGLQAGLSLE